MQHFTETDVSDGHCLSGLCPVFGVLDMEENVTMIDMTECLKQTNLTEAANKINQKSVSRCLYKTKTLMLYWWRCLSLGRWSLIMIMYICVSQGGVLLSIKVLIKLWM